MKTSFKIMWVLATFDLPVKTKLERKRYMRFRKQLLAENYLHLQFSVYLKHFPTFHAAQSNVTRLKHSIPPNGKVCFFYLTDKQYSMTANYYGPYIQREALPQKLTQALFFDNEQITMDGALEEDVTKVTNEMEQKFSIEQVIGESEEESNIEQQVTLTELWDQNEVEPVTIQSTQKKKRNKKRLSHQSTNQQIKF